MIKNKSEFVKKLESQWRKGNFVCVGLDSDYSKLPLKFLPKDKTKAMFLFNKKIIDATFDVVCAFKLNSAFYEAEGEKGFKALKRTVKYLKLKFPEIVIILDAKRADIGNTNNGYVKSAFDDLGVDAITVHPYLGKEALKPFLDRKDKGIIVLVKTSNPGATELQDLVVGKKKNPLYLEIASQVNKNWNENGNIAMVVGATYPKELSMIRKMVGDTPFLIPGIGAQGGDLEKTVKAGKDSRGWGMIINSSRGIIFAGKGKDYAKVAAKEAANLKEKIKQILAK